MGKITRLEFEQNYLVDPLTVQAFRAVEPWAILSGRTDSYHLRLSASGFKFLSNFDKIQIYSCDIPTQKWVFSDLSILISVMNAPFYINNNVMYHHDKPFKLYMVDKEQYMLLTLCDNNIRRLKELSDN